MTITKISYTMNEETKWLIGYVLSSWLSNFGHGMVVTVIGPSQPYLAYNVGVSIGISYYVSPVKY